MSDEMKEYGLLDRYLIFKLPKPSERSAFTNRAVDELKIALARRFSREQIKTVDEFAFVLTPESDQMSRDALATYAKTARQEGYELLADDLLELLDEIEKEIAE